MRSIIAEDSQSALSISAIGPHPRLDRVAAATTEQLSTALLAQLLGIHPTTATGWTQAAGNTRPAYAAELSRRNARERTR
jgi:hypothetical protein